MHLSISNEKLNEAARNPRQFLKTERGSDFSEGAVRQGIEMMLERQIDGIADDLVENFTSPHRGEIRELERILQHAPFPFVVADSQPVEVAASENVFNGKRAFSPAKYSAMIQYIAAQGLNIYKTNLNKLLFYADFSFFYLRGVGMSGAVYYNRPFGPVADPAEDLLKELLSEQKVKVVERTGHIEAADNAEETLDRDERQMLDWVLSTYGAMGAREISERSHTERPYYDTRPNEPIAYAYAQFLRQLPPKTLLDQ